MKIGNIEPGQILEYKKSCLFYPEYSYPVNLSVTDLGSISSTRIKECAIQPLYELLNKKGYNIRESFDYAEPSLNAVKGSVAPHYDKGLGLVAFWLLHKQPFDRKRESKKLCHYVDDPWLFTNNRSQCVSLGDVVVFNGDKTHSWMCNGGVYAISQTISRKRKSSPATI